MKKKQTPYIKGLLTKIKNLENRLKYSEFRQKEIEEIIKALDEEVGRRKLDLRMPLTRSPIDESHFTDLNMEINPLNLKNIY